MRCPKCDGLHLKVVMTKADQLDCNIRRRHCRVCGHRFYTVERALAEVEALTYHKASDRYTRQIRCNGESS